MKIYCSGRNPKKRVTATGLPERELNDESDCRSSSLPTMEETFSLYREIASQIPAPLPPKFVRNDVELNSL